MTRQCTRLSIKHNQATEWTATPQLQKYNCLFQCRVSAVAAVAVVVVDVVFAAAAAAAAVASAVISGVLTAADDADAIADSDMKNSSVQPVSIFKPLT